MSGNEYKKGMETEADGYRMQIAAGVLCAGDGVVWIGE